jgi:hypothetical protein
MNSVHRIVPDPPSCPTGACFLEKVPDIVGLYLNPPQNVLVSVRRQEEQDAGARAHGYFRHVPFTDNGSSH